MPPSHTKLKPPANIQADSIPEDDAPFTGIDKVREDNINGVAQVIQFGCVIFGQFADAGAIGMHGPGLTRETVKLARENSKIAAKVDLLDAVGPLTALIAAALPFAAQIMVNHGIFKAKHFSNAGVVEPEQLATQMKTMLMRQQMDTMRAQQQMQEEMDLLAREMASSTNGHGAYSEDEQ